MKKIILFLMFTLLMAAAGCGSDAGNDVEKGRGSDVLYTEDYLDSEYYIFDHSDYIVKAKLTGIGSYGGVGVYEFKVKKEYYGTLAEEVVHVYMEEDARYKIGRKYFLFLRSNGTVINEHIKYNMCSNHIFFPANSRVCEYGYRQLYTLKRSDIPQMIEQAAAPRDERAG